MPARLLLALAAALPLLLSGCRSTFDERVESARRAYYRGDLEDAAERLAKRLADDPDSPDAGVLRLELASALQAAGRYAEAARELVTADDQLELLDYGDAPLHELAFALFAVPRPVWRTSRPERLMLNVENMLNFLGAGDWEGAAVEARRARILMLQSDLSPARRYANGFAWALAGLSLQLAGRDAEAAGCFREAAALQAPDAGLSAPPPAGQGSVLVVVQNGKAPVRAQADYRLFLHGSLHRLQIPALASRGGGWGRAVVSVDGTPVGEAPLLLDLAAQAAHRWKDEFPRLLAAAALQMVPRALIGAAVERKLQTQHASNPEQDAWAQLAGIVAQELLAEALPADTRCWTLLPRDLRALRLSVPAGEHAIAVDLIGAGREPRRMEWQVTVDAGGFALVNAVTAPLEGWTAVPDPRGGDISATPAGQQALELLEAALVWRAVLQHAD